MPSRTSIVALGLALLANGCIYVPSLSVERRSASIGTAPRDPIQIGVTSRDEIVSRFGKPSYSTQDNRACGYLWSVTVGKTFGLIWGPCMPRGFGEADLLGDDDVWLEFDEAGILRRCQRRLVDHCQHNSENAWRRFVRTLKPSPT